jgi:hypothetical protein
VRRKGGGTQGRVCRCCWFRSVGVAVGDVKVKWVMRLDRRAGTSASAGLRREGCSSRPQETPPTLFISLSVFDIQRAMSLIESHCAFTSLVHSVV